MIVCPNCNHQNPDGAVQCEACYTPLPTMASCPNCGAAVQTDASFCGQCGFNLRTIAAMGSRSQAESYHSSVSAEIPELMRPDPLVIPEPLVSSPLVPSSESDQPEPTSPEPTSPEPTSPEPISPEPISPEPIKPASAEAAPSVVVSAAVNQPAIAGPAPESYTQLQQQSARLLHVQTNVTIELPASLTVIHIGKPNDRIPPDVDVSGFPNSEIVSRIHADIRVEGDAFYIEDVGSSNGTYINNSPLPMGNRHRLRSGDRIALGKGDKVSFLFVLS